ncbi:hypothetical protein HUT16_16685 [Kitasatospora sp. NA04385]|uniref:hypothetical protein n=1 Tax=Kitasatospora sp. NA04385 TaxID=2742135 RepID=UPI0015927E59|nr:hypothetical protein [Kitasatospora sp. NA04385]QKW20488.1 hypothetical protein HUT16_16685 [Kitasatospora sp. NA04385]
MTRHLNVVPAPDGGSNVDLQQLALLVAAQLNSGHSGALLPTAPAPAPAPVVVQPEHNAAVSRFGGYVAAGAGAAAVLIPVLLAATAALLAVGMAALALAVTSLVIRWIIRDMRKN